MVGRQVLRTRLAGWGVEESHFVGFAGDRLVPSGEHHETGHEVVERVEVVEPIGEGVSHVSVTAEDRHSPVSPKRLDLAVRYDDAGERDKCYDHQRIDERGGNGIRRIRSNRLSNGCIEKLVHYLQGCCQLVHTRVLAAKIAYYNKENTASRVR